MPRQPGVGRGDGAAGRPDTRIVKAGTAAPRTVAGVDPRGEKPGERDLNVFAHSADRTAIRVGNASPKNSSGAVKNQQSRGGRAQR